MKRQVRMKIKKRNGKVRGPEDWILDGFVICFMTVWAFICLYPLVYCLSMSLSGDQAIIANTVKMLPKGFSLDTYKIVFQNRSVTRSFGYAVLHTVMVTLISVSGTMLYGYVYSQKRFVLRGFMVRYTLLAMLLGGGMIPFFMQIKRMGLYNSYWALWLPAAVNLWNAMIAKSFFDSTIPDELLDAAKIDGCGDFNAFIRVVLPISKAIMAILALYAAVGAWNDYMGPLIYITDKSRRPLQVLIADILAVTSTNTGLDGSTMDAREVLKNMVNNTRMKYVLIVISTTPVLLVYPFFQKYFVKGVTIGSIKG